ncbi:MAG: HNH endonuclease [Bacteroidetes bacterium]|nr:HNH endonuclease [Bacteroidota bacterium]
MRLALLNTDPICQVCKVEPATEVHHLHPLSSVEGQQNKLNPAACITICFNCHVEATREERSTKPVRKRIKQIEFSRFD